ncbi:MAG: hypothetical protein CL853_05470 [Crocinitomicaceae bacterium]|nr:hypothetical protein [Crocinitomicaceae bacterium]
MEKNLPFDLPIADKAYNDRILPFLSRLDDGDVFKNFINTILKLSMYGFLVYGIYLSIMGLFGDSGFFSSIEYYDGWQGIGAYIGGPIGAILSIVVSWIGYSILKKRIEQLHKEQYDSLLKYLYKSLVPKMIIIVGELTFLLVLSLGVFQLIAAVLGSIVFAPLAELVPMLMSGNPMGEMISTPSCIGNYDYLMESISSGIIAIISSFILLMVYYIAVEAYRYATMLVINLLNFLPKLAIPLAIRKRNE